jgi:succinate-semialdehyde dehydrogenase / glutarate-semialdehyde dehydrogenase
MYETNLALHIDGAWQAGTRDSQAVINPATEETLGELPHASAEALDRALDAAQKAFEKWRNVSPWEREKVLRRAAQLIGERKEELARVMTLENGKPVADSRGEIDRVIETIEWCAEEGKRAYGRLMPPRTPGMMQTTFKRPIGPVAAFSPWNFPAVLLARKVAAALAAGCSIIIKPAEETPGVCVGLIRAFVDAGAPAGLINLVFGVPSEISEHLIASPVIRKVSFTGSVPVGKLLSRLASNGLKAITMELGGHSPVVVFDDVDIEKVAAAGAAFKFRNAGQVCISPNRFYVQESVYPRFLDRFIEVAKSIKVGNGLDPSIQMGPLTNERRLQAAENFVANARSRGAKVRIGGERIGNRGYFFQPTVLTEVDDDAEIMKTEPFCPVVPIMPFSTVDEAIRKANAVSYGLAAYAFTRSINRASAMSEAFEAGWIGINSFTPALADAPIGGVKESGVGYEGGPEGLDAYMQIKFLSQATH